MEDRTIIQLGSPASVRRGVRLNGIYEIETLIAQGGMGEVYKGFNIQTNDPVAIKMILPDLARNPEAFALFRREASTLHNLQHEAIVRYFVFSVDPELQRAYLAMEFVDGPSLTKRLAQGPLTLKEATILRRRIAGALEAAHRFGVIHRDISSDNVILPGNDPQKAKIIDFGIARTQRPGEGTLIGAGFAGKYNYVSPEQLGLAGGEVTAKSDTYSFGLVLAEALRGRPIDMNGTQVEIIEKRRAVPDLSDIHPSVRPLLQAMLQPKPADRPDMAAVAAWGEAAPAPASRSGKAESAARLVPEKEEGGSWVGRIAALVGIVIVFASVAATLYVFRDALPWSSAAVAPPSPVASASPSSEARPPEVATEPAPSHKLPPLPDPLPNQANSEPSPSPVSPPSSPGESEVKPPAAPHVPSADEIVQSLNQLKPKPEAPPAAAPHASGVQASAQIAPPKSEPAPPPVAAHPAAPVVAQAPSRPAPSPPPPAQTASPPPAIQAAPPPPATQTSAPPATAQATAPPTTAQAALPAPAPPAPAVSPPRAPQGALVIDDATVGRDYVADLPPFSDSNGAKTLVLRALPNPPDGLTFADLGSGFGQISGKPSAPGQYSFEIIATNSAGASAHMTTRISIAPAPPPAQNVAPPVVISSAEPAPPPAAPAEPAKTEVAALSPDAQAARFVSSFDGGPCFLARSLGAGRGPLAIQGIGSDRATFERFYKSFIQELGVEPALTVRLIGQAECPAVDLIRAGASGRAETPKIDLVGYDVGRNRPLSGTVSNLDGRRLDLLLVASDGKVYRLDNRVQSGGAATFTIPMTPDANSIEALQMLLAVASAKPIQALEGFKSGAAADILPRLRGELAAADGALEVEFFKLVK